MKKATHRLIFILLLMLSHSSWATSPATKDELLAQKEALQQAITANKELLHNIIESESTKTDYFEKRLEDQSSRISDIGSSIDRFGIIITLLLATLGLLGYLSVLSRASREAQESAKKWFDDNEERLGSNFADLLIKINDANSKIELMVQSVKDKEESAHAGILAILEDFQKEIEQKSSDNQGSPKNAAAAAAIQARATELQHEPEASYSFEDWSVRAVDAYKSERLEDSAYYWGRAAAIPGAGAENVARALFNRGMMLSLLKRKSEAIDIYTNLINRFINDTKPALEKHVASAMINKAAILGQENRIDDSNEMCDLLLSRFSASKDQSIRSCVARGLLLKGLILSEEKGNHTDAINIYEKIIEEHKNDSAPILKLQVIRAMRGKAFAIGAIESKLDEIELYDQIIEKYNNEKDLKIESEIILTYRAKAITLGKLNREEEQAAIYDLLIAQHPNPSSPAIKQNIALAMNGKAFILICKAKRNWSQKNFAEEMLLSAEKYLDGASKNYPSHGMIIGNIAYAGWLLGKHEAAEKHFREALNSAEFGGQAIYNATLPDLDIHPVEEDIGFRALIERLWAAQQA